MERAPSLDGFLGDPVSRWVTPSPSWVVWCESPELVGAVGWGRPSLQDANLGLEALNAFRHPRIARRFDVVFDARFLEAVDPAALGAVLAWFGEHRAELEARVRVHYSALDASPVGVALAGIVPIVSARYPFRVAPDPRVALRAVSSRGDEIATELERIVEEARSAPYLVLQLRAALRREHAKTSIRAVARSLGSSVRALQRALRESGTSFRDELKQARFSAARDLLVSSDAKISAVARRVGLSEGRLVELVREKAHVTPAELRRSNR
jgi:AraC-like DNA-binding protein